MLNLFRSRKSTLFACLLLAVASIVMFQNCEPTGDLTVSAKPSTSGSGGGQPYDGKPYVVRGMCDDGTLVRSRILARDGKYLLYREECESFSPRELSPSQVSQFLETIRYNDRTFVSEKPAIPLPGLVSWYIQLQGVLQAHASAIYIVDLFASEALEIARLKNQGHTVICTVSAGTYEDWNPDASKFPPSSLGKSVGAREFYVDIRNPGVREVMLARLDEAKRRGCQGVNFDNVDGYLASTGFALTRDDQLDYVVFLAFGAHDRDLILSLNNLPELAPLMSTIFDFAIAEQCFDFDECDAYQAFVQADKPVLAIEYGPVSAQECLAAADGRLSLAYFNKALDGTRYQTCP